MVIDTLDNLKQYESMNPLFAEVTEFLKSHNLQEMEEGKVAINGDRLFVNITTAKGKTPDEAVMETHEKMIDIQIPLSCAETYGYTPLCNLPKAEYNAEKDITKYPQPARHVCHLLPTGRTRTLYRHRTHPQGHLQSGCKIRRGAHRFYWTKRLSTS